MGRIITFRDLFGIIKDKASISKAALLSSSSTLNLAILRATTHTPSSPPDDRNISSLLLSGDGSRATASTLIAALMDRLHRTGNCIVALKCLLIIHNIIKRGSFILQDQLSIFPTSGGYNYLKLSAFRDGATSATWSLSAWVRWYARYLETLLSTSRVLGYFICSSSSSSNQDHHRISSLLNIDLIKDVDSLVTSIEEICKAPDSLLIENNLLVKEILGFLSNDYLSAVNETSIRLSELKERVSCLSFGESVELACSLKRLGDCKDRLSELFYLMKKPSIETMWVLADELRDGVGVSKVFSSSRRQGGYLVSREKTSESARFERTCVLKTVQFQSGRFGVNRFSDFS